jgi:flavin reductase (DIM6/NTAB) family NADH-FMN oxidoreductase RutF
MLDTDPTRLRRLRDAFGCFASGVTVVTMHDDKGIPTGITVNSFSSLSLDPPLLLFSVGCEQVSCRWLERADRFNVNVLGHDQEALAWQFARPSSDKFEGVAWHAGGNGVPLIDDAIARFECRKWNTFEGGDHMIVAGEILDFESSPGEPLLFYRGGMHDIAKRD